MTLRTEVISELDALERITPEWRALHGESGATFVTSPTWIAAWWRAMADVEKVAGLGGREILAIVVRDGTRMVGLALLCKRWAREAAIPRIRLDAMGTGEPREHEVMSEYTTVMADPQRRTAIAMQVAEAMVGSKAARWDELVLPMMRSDDPMVRALTHAFVQHRLDVCVEPIGGSDAALLPRTFEDYLASLSKSHRYTVKRSLNAFETWARAEGGFKLERLTDPARLDGGLSTLIRLHTARWGASNVFSSERFRSFHRDVMRSMLGGMDARLDLWALEVGGRPIASLYNIVANGIAYNYQAGRSTDVPKNVKPGIVTHLYAIQSAIAEGLREYDFLAGDAMYKRQLANTRHHLVTLRVRRTDARAVGLDLVTNILKRARDAIHPGSASSIEVELGEESSPTTPLRREAHS